MSNIPASQMPTAPVPTNINVGHNDDPTNPLVILVVDDVTGQHVSYMSPDNADAIAAILVEEARTARSGLQVVRGGGTHSNGGGKPTPNAVGPSPRTFPWPKNMNHLKP